MHLYLSGQAAVVESPGEKKERKKVQSCALKARFQLFKNGSTDYFVHLHCHTILVQTQYC